jgi:hypothetical protein
MKSLLLLAVLLFAGINSRATIVINNFDFETGGLPDGAFSNNPAAVPTGWTLTPVGTPAGAFYGYFNPENPSYPGTTGLPGVVGTMSGPNVFYFGDLERGYGLAQTLSENFTANTDYNLTVAWGIRVDSQFAADLRMTLSAGGNLLAEQTFLVSNYAGTYAGTFFDVSLAYTWNPAHTAYLGTPLTIAFFEEGSGFELDIDNVRMSAAAVPELGTWATGLLLAGGAAWWHRRRRISRAA